MRRKDDSLKETSHETHCSAAPACRVTRRARCCYAVVVLIVTTSSRATRVEAGATIAAGGSRHGRGHQSQQTTPSWEGSDDDGSRAIRSPWPPSRRRRFGERATPAREPEPCNRVAQFAAAFASGFARESRARPVRYLYLYQLRRAVHRGSRIPDPGPRSRTQARTGCTVRSSAARSQPASVAARSYVSSMNAPSAASGESAVRTASYGRMNSLRSR